MKNTKFTVLLVLFIFLRITSVAQVSSSFPINADGWTTPGDADGVITYAASGGNPGGLVSGSPFVIVLGAGSIYVNFYFVAPAKFLGIRSAYYNGIVRYEIQPSSTGIPNLHAEVIITSGATALYYYPAVPFQPTAPPTWSTFSVVLNNTLGFWKTSDSNIGASATEAQISAVLANLTNLQIRGLYRDANTTNRLDNVTLMPPITITSQPVSTAECLGDTATVTTSATGSSISYQWQKQTSPLPIIWTSITDGGGYVGTTLPSLRVSTAGNFGAGIYRCQISGFAANDVFTSPASITINALPTPPLTIGSASCGSGKVTLTASGGSSGQYRWYTVANGGTAISGQVNSNYVTPILTSTTIFFVSINNGVCEGTRSSVTATINLIPNPPIVTNAASCTATSFTLNASGGLNGQYRWYSQASGGTAITGEVNSSFTTPLTTSTTTYYVSINTGFCESTRSSITGTINTIPSPPTVTGASNCNPAAITLSAAGGINGQYRWYDVATGGIAISNQINNIFITPIINATTSYFVSINNGICESIRTSATASIIPIAKPTLTSTKPIVSNAINICEGDNCTLTSSVIFPIYTWSNGASSSQITIDKMGVYSLIVTDASGCVSPSSDLITLHVNPFPLAEILAIGTQLKATVGDSYQWYQNGVKILSATNQTFDFNFLEYGIYKVEVTENGCTSSSIPFEYLITGLEKNLDNVKVYPNPVEENLVIEFNPPFQIDIMDVNGKVVYHSVADEPSKTITLSLLPKGIYFIQIENKAEKHGLRISKK